MASWMISNKNLLSYDTIWMLSVARCGGCRERNLSSWLVCTSFGTNADTNIYQDRMNSQGESLKDVEMSLKELERDLASSKNDFERKLQEKGCASPLCLHTSLTLSHSFS